MRAGACAASAQQRNQSQRRGDHAADDLDGQIALHQRQHVALHGSRVGRGHCRAQAADDGPENSGKRPQGSHADDAGTKESNVGAKYRQSDVLCGIRRRRCAGQDRHQDAPANNDADEYRHSHRNAHQMSDADQRHGEAG
jgi:hypothetical protein